MQKAFLLHQPFGQGHVIGFAEDPNYRAFTESTMLLFTNAVLLGSGYEPQKIQRNSLGEPTMKRTDPRMRQLLLKAVASLCLCVSVVNLLPD